MVMSGVSFEFMSELTLYSWLLVIASSSLTIMTQLSKFNAFKYS